jgi:hypothetical protein
LASFGGDALGSAAAAKIFISVWLAVAIVNLWIGVSKAGYTIREELPILLIVSRCRPPQPPLRFGS